MKIRKIPVGIEMSPVTGIPVGKQIINPVHI